MSIQGQIIDLVQLYFDEGLRLQGSLEDGGEQRAERPLIVELDGFVGQVIEVINGKKGKFGLVFLRHAGIDPLAEKDEFFPE